MPRMRKKDDLPVEDLRGLRQALHLAQEVGA